MVLRVAWGSEAGAYAFHRQPESIGGATGKRFESPLGVPVGGAFVECVDRDHADREMLVCFDDSVQRLLQEPGAELSFAVALVAGEPGDERRAHLVEADQTAAFPAGQPFDFDRGGHECDVSGDHFLADRSPVGVVDGDERP